MSGHIFDMVNRIKQNTTRKRKKFQGDNRALIYSEKRNTSTAYTFPTVSESEMELLKIQIAKNTKTRYFKSLYVFAIVMAIVIFAFWAFLRYFSVNPYTIAS